MVYNTPTDYIEDEYLKNIDLKLESKSRCIRNKEIEQLNEKKDSITFSIINRCWICSKNTHHTFECDGNIND